MRKNVLFITIGGSCEPIVTTINSLKPDFIYFICSSDIGESKGSYSSVIGEGLVCGPFGKPNKPNIVSQCELNTEQYQIVKLSDCDDHNKCYSECYGLLQTASIRFPDADLIIDYTGGTKSMSGGVLLAATDFEDVIVCLAKGARKDLAKVVDGTERNIRTRLNVPLLKKRIGAIHDLIRRYEYQAAESQIENVFLVPDLPENILIELGVLEKFCKCLNEWDKFNHSIAADIAKTNNCLDSQLLMQLQNVINSRRCIEEGKPIPITDLFSRYEVIFDLIKNAERKAIQEKYEDATGRLYRATELLAQARLKIEYKIETGNIDINHIPEGKRQPYEKFADESGKIKVGLFDAYKILSYLNDSIVGPIFSKQEKRLMSGLEIRNSSILAHGFITVDKSRYNTIYKSLIMDLVLPILQKLMGDSYSTFTQLPNHAPHRL